MGKKSKIPERKKLFIFLVGIVKFLVDRYRIYQTAIRYMGQKPEEECVKFTDLYGKTFSLTPQEINEIIGLYEKRVLPYVIADKYGLSMHRLIRVLTYVKNNNHLNIKK